MQDRLGLLERGADRSGDEVARGHQRGDRLVDVGLEAEVAIREDADEHTVGVGDRHAGDLVMRHQLERVAYERIGRQRHGLHDHPRLGALHLVDLCDLVLDREVAVHDPDAAFACERDREPRLGDGVHRGGDDRDAQRDRPREPRQRRDVVREHTRLRRDEQHVVERQAFLGELPVQSDEPLQLVLAEFDAQGMTRVPPCPARREPTRS